mgnify:CR=1 FL=1
MLKIRTYKKDIRRSNNFKKYNLEIEDGEIVSILGPSGCGKTTLLNLILGLTDVDQGKIIFNNKDITDIPMEKKRVQHCISGLCIISKSDSL